MGALHQSDFCSRSPELRPSGFSLAEVLITLVIIGVIAAITVPTLITKYQKEQTVARLKKAYSSFSQAFVKSQTDFGTNYTFDIDFGNNDEKERAFKEHFLKYIKYSKYCKENFSECYPSKVYNLDGSLFWNFEATNSRPNSYAYALDDGICVVSWLARDHIQFYTDINCKKGPNKLGRDIFQITLFTAIKTDYSNIKGFSRVGVHFPRYSSASGDMDFNMTRQDLLSEDSIYNCNKNRRGNNCGAVIQMDGWRIADDYPW